MLEFRNPKLTHHALVQQHARVVHKALGVVWLGSERLHGHARVVHKALGVVWLGSERLHGPSCIEAVANHWWGVLEAVNKHNLSLVGSP